MFHDAFNSTVHSSSKHLASLSTSGYTSTGSVVRESPQDISGSTSPTLLNCLDLLSQSYIGTWIYFGVQKGTLNSLPVMENSSIYIIK